MCARGRLAGVFSASTMWVTGMKLRYWSPLSTLGIFFTCSRMFWCSWCFLLNRSVEKHWDKHGEIHRQAHEVIFHSGFLGSLRDSKVDLRGPAWTVNDILCSWLFRHWPMILHLSALLRLACWHCHIRLVGTGEVDHLEARGRRSWSEQFFPGFLRLPSLFKMENFLSQETWKGTSGSSSVKLRSYNFFWSWRKREEKED